MIGNCTAHMYMMVYTVRSLNYCSVTYYYAYAMHALRMRMSYRFVTILAHTTLHYSYAMIQYVTIFDLYHINYDTYIGIYFAI